MQDLQRTSGLQESSSTPCYAGDFLSKVKTPKTSINRLQKEHTNSRSYCKFHPKPSSYCSRCWWSTLLDVLPLRSCLTIHISRAWTFVKMGRWAVTCSWAPMSPATLYRKVWLLVATLAILRLVTVLGSRRRILQPSQLRRQGPLMAGATSKTRCLLMCQDKAANAWTWGKPMSTQQPRLVQADLPEQAWWPPLRPQDQPLWARI